MSLKDKVTQVDAKYHTDSYRRVIEDHRAILRENSSITTIDSGTGLKFENNYLGLLNSLNIRPRYRFAVMRINNIINPRACGVVGRIYLPNYGDIDNLVSMVEISERDLF